MQEKPTHVLAISSFAVHGTASLKTFISILGDKILPVPTLLLNGLTNMSLVQKFELPFRELLQSTFGLARDRSLDLILYIGYIGKAEQADIILEMIDAYSSSIKTIITDPVCGDHGKTYVPIEVVECWPAIIERSDIVFPNVTELKLLAGNAPDAEIAVEECAAQFCARYPNVKPIVTSITYGTKIGIRSFGDTPFQHMHHLLPQNYGGSGDAFLALFISNYFYKKLPFNDALKKAADQTYNVIKNSFEKQSTDLILNFDE